MHLQGVTAPLLMRTSLPVSAECAPHTPGSDVDRDRDSTTYKQRGRVGTSRETSVSPAQPDARYYPHPRTNGDGVVKILAGKLFDPYTLTLLAHQAIRVSTTTGRVLDVSPYLPREDGKDVEEGQDEEGVIDLSHMTVLPGFVDTHVHLFLHPYAETSWADQLTKESIAERTIRATTHARRTLLAGFTTVREWLSNNVTLLIGRLSKSFQEQDPVVSLTDLGTEGAGDADIGLRKCLSTTSMGTDPIVPGPRYFCASRAIVPTGSYGPKGVIHVDKEGVDGITGAEAADGPDECIKAVRRQIGAGADWIKIYADYRVRSRMEGVSAETGRQSTTTFNDGELKALVDTAHMYGVKVAAHAVNGDTIAKLLTLGVDSIEHGYDVLSVTSATDLDEVASADGGRRILHTLAQSKTTWVPTLGAFYTLSDEPAGARTWARAAKAFQTALEEGVGNIACGGDTGVFAHGRNALEMALMVQLGADWKQVVKWGTLGGWECIRSMRWEGQKGTERLAKLEEAGGTEGNEDWVGDNEVPFGAIRSGWAADVIATCGDLEVDFEDAVSAGSIRFVMKAGRVYKRDGRMTVE